MRLHHLLFVTAAFLAPAALAQTDSPAAVQQTQDLNQDQAARAAQSNAQYQQQQQINRNQAEIDRNRQDIQRIQRQQSEY